MNAVTRNEIFALALRADHMGQRNLASRLYAIGACMSGESSDDIGYCSNCYKCRDCKGDARAGREIAGKLVLSEL